MYVSSIIYLSSKEKTPKVGFVKFEFTCISSKPVSKVKHLVCITVAPWIVERERQKEKESTRKAIAGSHASRRRDQNRKCQKSERISKQS